MIWFSSDFHFGHARINELANRPFSSVSHMNEVLIRQWNEVVSPDDQAFVLGDVAMGSIADSLPLAGRLNGDKYLISGNHDRVFSQESDVRQARFRPAYEDVFYDVISELETIQLVPDGPLMTMCHFPYAGDSQADDRYADMRPHDDGRILLHGHTHSKERVSRSPKGTLQIHVGVDSWDFRPVSEYEILALIKENT